MGWLDTASSLVTQPATAAANFAQSPNFAARPPPGLPSIDDGKEEEECKVEDEDENEDEDEGESEPVVNCVCKSTSHFEQKR